MFQGKPWERELLDVPVRRECGREWSALSETGPLPAVMTACFTLAPRPPSCSITGMRQLRSAHNRRERIYIQIGQSKLTEQREKRKSQNLGFQPETDLSNAVATSHVGPVST